MGGLCSADKNPPVEQAARHQTAPTPRTSAASASARLSQKQTGSVRRQPTPAPQPQAESSAAAPALVQRPAVETAAPTAPAAAAPVQQPAIGTAIPTAAAATLQPATETAVTNAPATADPLGEPARSAPTLHRSESLSLQPRPACTASTAAAATAATAVQVSRPTISPAAVADAASALHARGLLQRSFETLRRHSASGRRRALEKRCSDLLHTESVRRQAWASWQLRTVQTRLRDADTLCQAYTRVRALAAEALGRGRGDDLGALRTAWTRWLAVCVKRARALPHVTPAEATLTKGGDPRRLQVSFGEFVGTETESAGISSEYTQNAGLRRSTSAEEVADDGKTAPKVLFISGTKQHNDCDGEYVLCPGELVHEKPLWKRQTGARPRFLGSTVEGYWMVCGSRDDAEKGVGWMCTVQPHDGVMPHVVEEWENGADEGADTGIQVAVDPPSGRDRSCSSPPTGKRPHALYVPTDGSDGVRSPTAAGGMPRSASVPPHMWGQGGRRSSGGSLAEDKTAAAYQLIDQIKKMLPDAVHQDTAMVHLKRTRDALARSLSAEPSPSGSFSLTATRSRSNALPPLSPSVRGSDDGQGSPLSRGTSFSKNQGCGIFEPAFQKPQVCRNCGRGKAVHLEGEVDAAAISAWRRESSRIRSTTAPVISSGTGGRAGRPYEASSVQISWGGAEPPQRNGLTHI